MRERFESDPVLRATYALSRFGAWFGGFLVLIAAIIIAIDIVIRKLFALSVGGADELAGFSLAIGSIWAFGFALMHRAHIRIDSVYMLMSKPIRAGLDVAALVAFTGFFALVGWHGLGVLTQSIAVGTRSMSPLGTPLVIPQALWIVGFLSMLIVCAVLLWRTGQALLRRDAAEIVELTGSRRPEEEVQEEIAVLEHMRKAARRARM